MPLELTVVSASLPLHTRKWLEGLGRVAHLGPRAQSPQAEWPFVLAATGMTGDSAGSGLSGSCSPFYWLVAVPPPNRTLRANFSDTKRRAKWLASELPRHPLFTRLLSSTL